MKILFTILMLLIQTSLSYGTGIVYKIRDDALVTGAGSESVSSLKTELPINLRKAVKKKGDVAIYENDVPCNFEIKLAVDVEYVKQYFNHYVMFKRVTATIEKDGAEVGSVSTDYEIKAGDYKTYGTEGRQFALKAASDIADLLSKSSVISGVSHKNESNTVVASTNNAEKEHAVALDNGIDSIGPMPRGKAIGKHDVAVIIGNKNYKKTSKVDYALSDALKVKELVINTMGFSPENVIYVEDATLSDFTEIFGSQNDNKSKLSDFIEPGVSNVFVYYVGHGAPDIHAEKPEAYFVSIDSDPQYLSVGGYKVKTLYDNLSALPAKSITVVLDSCFSGNSPKGVLFKGISGLVVVGKQPVLPAVNSVVLTSTSENQVSSWYEEKQHSLFTYFFLKGLQGDADKNHDKKITVGELNEYLSYNVPRLAKKITGNIQTPVITGKQETVLVTLR